MANETPFEHDAHIVEQDGEVLPAYEGVNAPVFPKTPEHQPTFDDLLEMHGHLADAALAGAEAEIPDNIRDMAAEARAKKAKDPMEEFLARQRARYNDSSRWN